MKTSVLALDLATTTGWAWHANPMPRPFFGAFRLPGGPSDIGQPAAALEAWLLEHLATADAARQPITHIFFEAQHIAEKINIDTAYRLIGLGATIEKVAYQEHIRRGGRHQHKIHVYKVFISEWRKHFLGRGAGFKKTADKKAYLPGEDPKELAILRCRQYGWFTDIADAAEACGILDYSLSMIGDDIHPRPWRDEALLKGSV